MRRVLAALVVAVTFLPLVPGTASAAAPTETSACVVATGRAHRCATIGVLGHRGQHGPSSGTNEDTLWALRRDAMFGAGFESDTWRLASPAGVRGMGPMVIIHDSTLRRTVDPESLPDGVTQDTHIADITPAQWDQLRTLGGEKLPYLRQWVRLAASLHVPGIMEVKWSVNDPARWAALVTDSGAQMSWYSAPHKIGSNCNQSASQALLDVGQEVGLKYDPVCPMTLQEIADFGYSYVAGPDAEDPTYIQQAHALGLAVLNYDSGKTEAWTALVNAGADAVIVPRPRAFQEWRGVQCVVSVAKARATAKACT